MFMRNLMSQNLKYFSPIHFFNLTSILALTVVSSNIQQQWLQIKQEKTCS